MTEPTLPSSQPADGAPVADDNACRVRVGEFEGPLDLLLHLVRVNEVEITDIPIIEITRQYNEYLEMMRELNLEIAGEFLVMAATLMHIKSRVLLPPDPAAAEEEGAEDPRAELAQQLLDYQRFKQAAENLEAMHSQRSLIWTRAAIPEEFKDEELLAVGLFDLIEAFKGLLGRLGDEARLELRRDTVSVAEKIAWLTDLLERRRSLDLLELLADLPTRLDRIATFLAVLEMMKLQLIVAFQRKLFGEIRVTAVGDRDAAPAGEACSETGGAPAPAERPEGDREDES